MKNAYETFKKFLSKSKKFDAVFCYNDIYAFAVMKALKEVNLKVSEDVSVMGFDDIEFSSVISPALTTVRIDKIKLGEEAFKGLTKGIRESVLTEIILPVQLIERESVAKR